MKFPRSPRRVCVDAITRRQALRRIGAFAGAATLSPLLAGCGDDGNGGTSTSPLLPEELDIETIIVVMMENRSFDHYFGSLSLVEGRTVDGLRPGFANPRRDTSIVEPFHMALRCVADPPHGFGSSHDQVNGGANDGFVREHAMRVGDEHGDEVMGYYVRDQLPFLYALSDEFMLCDRWHCSVLGPTFPNRYFLHSAQSDGRKDNTPPSGGAQWTTIYDRLDDAGIPWKSYFSDLPALGLWPRFLFGDKLRRIEEFYEDARSGQLPAVCHVEPAYTLNDDHPPHDIRLGQAFLSSVVHAVGQGPQWERSLIVVTYDEHGGFFDHVAPGKVEDERADQGFDQLGVRVPGLVISPYTPVGAVSSILYEHSSVPAFIGWLFGLAPLTVRDANANIFLDAFDPRQVRRADPRPFPELPVVDVDPVTPLECAAFAGAGGAQDIELYADAGGIPRSLDLRRETPEIAEYITRELLRMGAGRRVRYR